MLRSTKKTSVENTLVFCFIRYLKFHPQGWIRTAAATSLKTAQKQPSATAMTAASGRSREELLGLRPAGCACHPRHDAAAGSHDPGSFLFLRGSRYPPAPTKKTSVENTLVFCFIRYLKFHSRGWIRTAAAMSLKTAQKQPSATATTAACGGNREARLGQRPGFLFILRGSRNS